jgi:hypothetical protein
MAALACINGAETGYRNNARDLGIGGIKVTKHTKKDGGTKQKGKNRPKHKTSGSANGQNGYH